MSMSDKFQFLSLCTSNIHSMDHQLYKEGGGEWEKGLGVERELTGKDRRRGIRGMKGER